MSELAVRMTGDEAHLVSSILNVIGKSRESAQEFDRVAAASETASKSAREAAREQARLGNEGKRLAQNLKKENENLSEAYDRQTKALHEAHTQGKIDADQLKLSLTQLEKKYEDQAAANRQASLESSKAWQQQKADVRDGIAVINRLEKETESLEDHYVRLRRQI
ncbi:MAG: hypothetical protein R3C03_23870, partial [Pirellulaceae bacterium]